MYMCKVGEAVLQQSSEFYNHDTTDLHSQNVAITGKEKLALSCTNHKAPNHSDPAAPRIQVGMGQWKIVGVVNVE